MTLGEHLDELRRRVVRGALAVVLGMVVAFVFNKPLLEGITEPYREAMRDLHAPGQFQVTEPLDGFVLVMKLCFLVGLVGTAPLWLSQMWSFISAGLYPKERRVVRVFFPISVGLFALGGLCAYLMVLPVGMRFLIGWNASHGWQSNFAVGAYISMCVTFVIGMGVAFQMPLVMLFLQATGIFARETFSRGWRLAILSAFVVSMIVTPDPTPISQVMMALPLVGLYFLGVWGGRFVGETKEPFTVWKSWPLLLMAAAMAAMFLFRRDIQGFATSLFS